MCDSRHAGRQTMTAKRKGERARRETKEKSLMLKEK
jgi:hypothetical protein